jgi:pimeloyl-ACP methyl ester carboxylesterase
MPPRRRKDDTPNRRWIRPLLFFTLSILAGATFWAYTPDLPRDLLIRRYANAQSQFIDVGGVRAHVRDYTRAGDKPSTMPLLLIHGSLGSLQVWDGWVAALENRYRVITVDLPGHGLTGPWPRNEYTVDAYADFVEVLADTLRLDRFAIAGHSMGGAVAWTFAATRPERVADLILVDSAGYPAAGPAPLWLRLARLKPIGDLAVHFKPEPMLRRALLESYADPTMVTQERLQRYGDLQRFPGNRAATLQRLRTQEPLDPTTLRHLDLPTLILWGAKDRQVPVADAERFKKDIRNAELVVFDALGHSPMEEDPAATAAAVKKFLPAELPALPPPPPQPAPSADQPVAPSITPEKD